jgi:hypothetical protein
MKLSQKQWEFWFLLSTIIFLLFIFVGTLKNSKITFPNWYYGMIGACVNMFLSIYVGCNPKYMKDEKI